MRKQHALTSSALQKASTFFWHVKHTFQEAEQHPAANSACMTCHGAAQASCCSASASHLAQLLCVFAGVRARRVDKGDDGEAELVGVAHEAKRFAVAIGLGHAEVAVDVLLCI